MPQTQQPKAKEDKETSTPAEATRAAAEETLEGVDIPIDDDLIMEEDEGGSQPDDNNGQSEDEEDDESADDEHTYEGDISALEEDGSITPADALGILENIKADVADGKIETAEVKKEYLDYINRVTALCEASFLRENEEKKKEGKRKLEWNPDNEFNVGENDAKMVLTAIYGDEENPEGALRAVRSIKVSKSASAVPQATKGAKQTPRKIEVPEALTPQDAKARLEVAESKEEIEAIMAACRRSGFLVFVDKIDEKTGKVIGKRHDYTDAKEGKEAKAIGLLVAFTEAIRRTPPKAKTKPEDGKEKGGNRPEQNGKPKSAPNPFEIVFDGKKITPAEALARFKGPTRNRYEEALQAAISNIAKEADDATKKIEMAFSPKKLEEIFDIEIEGSYSIEDLQEILKPFIQRGIIRGPLEGKSGVYFTSAQDLKAENLPEHPDCSRAVKKLVELATSKTNALNRSKSKNERGGKRMTSAELRGAIAVLPPQFIAGVRVRMIQLRQNIPTGNGILRKDTTFGLDDPKTPEFLKRAARDLIQAKTPASQNLGDAMKRSAEGKR